MSCIEIGIRSFNLKKRLKFSLKVVKFFTGKSRFWQKSHQNFKFSLVKKNADNFFKNVSCGKPPEEKFR